VVLGPRDLGPQDGLVEVELPVEFLHHGGLGGHVDHRVDALWLLLDLVGETALAPDVDGWTVRSSRLGSRMIMIS
jgi:hypothetical protein